MKDISELVVLYSFPVVTSRTGGKNRATRQKLEAMRGMVRSLYVSTADGFLKYNRLLHPLLVEIKTLLILLKKGKAIDCYITRGGLPLLSITLAKMLGIYTLREVHADAIDEVKYLKKNYIQKRLLYIYALFSSLIEKMADRRIYNNPRLLERKPNSNDKFVYNGGALEGVSRLSKADARLKFRFSDDVHYLIFTGSASEWHGVDYLVNLQRSFVENRDAIQIVCGGGRVDARYDPDGLLINITPLNEFECADLVAAGDACLLPVKDNRVSPGSPLKLYDYMVNAKPVITQVNVPGYSDEVGCFKAGITVDFKNSIEAREKILKFLLDEDRLYELGRNGLAAFSRFSWQQRISCWFD